MKKIPFLFLFYCMSASAQISTVTKQEPSITVGKVAPMGSFIAELVYRINKDEKDTIYTLMYRDAKYSRIISVKSVSFSGVDNTLNELYKAFKTVFTEENRKNKDYAINFDLGVSPVSIHNYRLMGAVAAAFFHEGAIVYLTERQLDKLFAKE